MVSACLPLVEGGEGRGGMGLTLEDLTVQGGDTNCCRFVMEKGTKYKTTPWDPYEHIR